MTPWLAAKQSEKLALNASHCISYLSPKQRGRKHPIKHLCCKLYKIYYVSVETMKSSNYIIWRGRKPLNRQKEETETSGIVYIGSRHLELSHSAYDLCEAHCSEDNPDHHVPVAETIVIFREKRRDSLLFPRKQEEWEGDPLLECE